MHQGDIPEPRKYFQHAELTSSASFTLCFLVKKIATHPYVYLFKKSEDVTKIDTVISPNGFNSACHAQRFLSKFTQQHLSRF